MAHFVFVTWDGGGNVSVALGIGAALAERGHLVTVIGPSSLRDSIQGLHLAFQELGPSAPLDSGSRSDYLVQVVGSTTLGDGLYRLVERLEPDGLVIDCNLSWALELPTPIRRAVLVHTALGLYLPVWQPVIDAANARRVDSGLPPFLPAAEVWRGHEVLLIASVAHFDRPPVPFPLNAAYVGLVRSRLRTDAGSVSTLESLTPPLVLVSYSTDPLQNRAERVQTALDALADVPVRVVATSSGAFGVDQLSVPPNAVVLEYIPHDQVMPQAAVVVGHAGHGTTLSALCHGVPLVCVPGLGRDQIPIAARVAELGLGIALADGATSEDIRAAVRAILSDGSYQRRVQEFKSRCDDVDGAQTAALTLEAMVEPV